MTQPHPPTDAALLAETCGFQQIVGYRLTEWREDFARIEQALGPLAMNRQGVPHGGLHATLLDTAMGFAGCYTGQPDKRRLALTLSMSVNYMAQATGSRLIAEGWRVGGGRKTYFAEGRVTDDTGAVIASATAVFRYIKGA